MGFYHNLDAAGKGFSRRLEKRVFYISLDLAGVGGVGIMYKCSRGGVKSTSVKWSLFTT